MVALATPPEVEGLSAREAGCYVAAELSVAAGLHERDGMLYPLTDAPVANERAEALRAAWLTWLTRAAALIEQCEPIRHRVARLIELRIEVATVRALLDTTPQELRAAVDAAAARGAPVLTAEEARAFVAERKVAR